MTRRRTYLLALLVLTLAGLLWLWVPSAGSGADPVDAELPASVVEEPSRLEWGWSASRRFELKHPPRYSPWGAIAADGREVVLVDRLRGTLRRYDLDGRYLGRVLRSGRGEPLWIGSYPRGWVVVSSLGEVEQLTSDFRLRSIERTPLLEHGLRFALGWTGEAWELAVLVSAVPGRELETSHALVWWPLSGGDATVTPVDGWQPGPLPGELSVEAGVARLLDGERVVEIRRDGTSPSDRLASRLTRAFPVASEAPGRLTYLPAARRAAAERSGLAYLPHIGLLVRRGPGEHGFAWLRSGIVAYTGLEVPGPQLSVLQHSGRRFGLLERPQVPDPSAPHRVTIYAPLLHPRAGTRRGLASRPARGRSGLSPLLLGAPGAGALPGGLVGSARRRSSVAPGAGHRPPRFPSLMGDLQRSRPAVAGGPPVSAHHQGESPGGRGEADPRGGGAGGGGPCGSDHGGPWSPAPGRLEVAVAASLAGGEAMP